MENIKYFDESGDDEMSFSSAVEYIKELYEDDEEEDNSFEGDSDETIIEFGILSGDITEKKVDIEKVNYSIKGNELNLEKFTNQGKVDFFIDDNNLHRLTNFLDSNNIEYSETSITPNKTWVYNPNIWDSSLMSKTHIRTTENKVVPKYDMDELDRLIAEKIEEELDCKILDRVCAMLNTVYGKKKIHKAVRALIINQGMRDIDACLSHIENQLEGVN